MDSLISSAVQTSQAETALKVQMSVLKKSMDVQKNIGEMIVGLIDSAAMQTPGKSVGLGNKIDLFA